MNRKKPNKIYNNKKQTEEIKPKKKINDNYIKRTQKNSDNNKNIIKKLKTEEIDYKTKSKYEDSVPTMQTMNSPQTSQLKNIKETSEISNEINKTPKKRKKSNSNKKNETEEDLVTSFERKPSELKSPETISEDSFTSSYEKEEKENNEIIFVDKIKEKQNIKIIYKFDNIKRKEFKILGKFFVENNKDNIDLIINGKVFGLDENLKINNHSVEIILRQKMDKDKKKFINNMSCMFCDCEANEIEFSEVKNAKLLDLSHVTDISKMFKNCSNLDKIDLKFLENSRQVIRIDYLFSNCKNLKDVFHIDSLDTKSVINMYRVFNGCSSINNINDLNNWKINNVDNFNEMFEGCTSLTNIPDISKWDVKNVKSMKRMFKGCIALKEIPDISKWDVGNVKSLKGMFKGCTALTKIPNISKWDVKNVTSMKGMFKGCICLKNFPDLTAWKQKLINLKSIEKMFYGCRNLIYTEKNTIENFLKLDNIDNITSNGAFDDSMP